MRYHERLLPAWWACLLAFALLACLAIAYGAALGASIGWAVAVIGGILVTWLIWITSPVVEVDERELRVGGAALPRNAVGPTEAVDADRVRALTGPGSDARLFVALRPWSARGGVLVHVADEEDPHPAWLFSSRHPDRIVAALTATM